MTASFYKAYWLTIGSSMIGAVQNFFENGHLLKAINHTFISLIPKIDQLQSVEQYRLIALCNLSYMIITKIMAARPKLCLDSTISPAQAAFIPNRKMGDNVIISHEIMHHLNRKRGSLCLMALKVDLAKAYDRVE